jgi:GNAT superfamily N-acetyltransferase
VTGSLASLDRVTLEIRPAPMDVVCRLRHLILRPHQPPEDLVFEHDLDADALHLGAFEDDEPVAVASITREPPPREDDAAAWRVRGMATIATHRDRGIGGELLERCVAHARARGGAFVWLNGRTPAARFYERHGFVARGDVIDVPAIGPHLEFRRSLRYPPPTRPEERA